MNEIRDILLGLDLGKITSQLCYFDRKTSKVQPVPIKVGSSENQVATNICKRIEQDDYCIGQEADFFSKQKQGILIENLYKIWEDDKPVEIEKESIQPSELLAEYIKGMLRFLGLKNPVQHIKCMGVSVEVLHQNLLKNIQTACEILGFKKNQIHIMDYGESFYYYAMSQKLEVRNRFVGWYDFKEQNVCFKRLAVNSYMKPVMVRMEGKAEKTLSEDWQERDLDFYKFIQDTLKTDLYTSIQITGKGFDPDVFQKSVKSLCKNNRKVYAGENLFSFGACEAVREVLERKMLKGFLYLSESLVKVNVGMDMLVKGAASYYPLIQAGKNWYECTTDFEMILDKTEELVFEIQEMGEKNKRQIGMLLPGLPVRPDKTTRLHVNLTYRSPKICDITIRDMGFGEMFPSSGLTWTESVEW